MVNGVPSFGPKTGPNFDPETGQSLLSCRPPALQVSGELAQRLFAITEKIHRKLPEQLGGDDEDSVFPVLPGSHLRLTNPALEFVKALHKASCFYS